MALDHRPRLQLPHLAPPLPLKLAAPLPHASAPSRSLRLSPVETKALPSLARLPSLTRARPSTPATTTVVEATGTLDEADERTVRDLAARLALLLHARECCQGRVRGDAAAGTAAPRGGCLVRHCGVARGVLDHCQECFLPQGRCHVSCAQAKRLLRHFRLCRARRRESACRLCATLHREFPWALPHAASLSPLLLRRAASEPEATAPARQGDEPLAVRLRRVVSAGGESEGEGTAVGLQPAKRTGT